MALATFDIHLKSAKIHFHRLYDDALMPLSADTSALGTLPTVAFQYCEALRTASAYGWYVFPPKDFSLLWDGKQTYYADEGDWRQLSSLPFEQSFRDTWNKNAPEDLEGCDPPFLTALSVPGIVQIWSGLLVETSPGWALKIRPVVNAYNRSMFTPFEAIVETDTFGPSPLFTNVQLHTTDREILFSRQEPLFHVQPIQKSSYQDAKIADMSDGFSDGTASFDWDRFKTTIRASDPVGSDHKVGRYGAQIRRKGRKRD